MNIDEERFQRSRRNWLGYGRGLLTLVILSSITIAVYLWAHSGSHHLDASHQIEKLVVTEMSEALHLKQLDDDYLNSDSNDDLAVIINEANNNLPKRIKRTVDPVENLIEKVSPIEQELHKNNNSNNDDLPKIDSEILAINTSEYLNDGTNSIQYDISNHSSLKRRHPNKNVPIIHKHTDGVDYIFYKQYTCIPFRPPESSRSSMPTRTRRPVRPNFMYWQRNGMCSSLSCCFLCSIYVFLSKFHHLNLSNSIQFLFHLSYSIQLHMDSIK
jgi:hypothetical protein